MNPVGLLIFGIISTLMLWGFIAACLGLIKLEGKWSRRLVVMVLVVLMLLDVWSDFIMNR